MRRHMKLIGMLLEYVERHPGFGDIPTPTLPDFSRQEVAYHIRLCGDAGYLVLKKGQREEHPIIVRMTWCGHKALEGMTA